MIYWIGSNFSNVYDVKRLSIKQMHRFFVILFSSVIISLLLTGCDSGIFNKEEYGLYPFDQTGLTDHGHETAEEILFRAHNGDCRAMVLAVAGYQLGIGGFPRSLFLSQAWVAHIWLSGAVEAGSFAELIFYAKRDVISTADIPYIVAACEKSKESYLGPRFSKAGLFDAEKVCSEFGEWMIAPNKNERWATHKERKRAGDILILRDLVRDLVDRPATLDEQQFLLEMAKFFSPEAIFFYAATTHDPNKEAPDWDEIKLRCFLDAQRSFMNAEEFDGNYSEGKEISFSELLNKGEEKIKRKSNHDAATVLTEIRNAHLGYPDALRFMVDKYRTGDFGFPVAEYLSIAWENCLAYVDEAGAIKVVQREIENSNSTKMNAWVLFALKNVPLGSNRRQIDEMNSKAERLHLDAEEKKKVHDWVYTLETESREWRESVARNRKLFGSRRP